MKTKTLRRAAALMREDADSRWHAVADWLDITAVRFEKHGHYVGDSTLDATTVARAYLRESE